VKLLVLTMNKENLKSILWSLVGINEEEYREKFHIVHYLMFTYINRELLRESMQSFVLDIFNSPVSSREWLVRAHDIYHNLLMWFRLKFF
jgi:predicted component of type VI protein secretion system